MQQINKYYKIVIALGELLLAVPFLGASIVFGSAWTVLGLMMFLHIIGIVLSVTTKQSMGGHIFGVIANLIAFIPFVGMLVHGITGLVLLIQGFATKIPQQEQQ
ncbi:hypothetical protein CVD28_02930 [Bacillus sp. M6-12]|uniref:hypothetical protein n=1 Tax=Bacillus sp. M6-12 TaxID=2054166 RepID=UPI000C775669|nr:hypothetical protein [Bacillus sp. M6-12]PLS19386.1 hypothetical protein CVD28_02930 [Bacillus sp. M6-12]